MSSKDNLGDRIKQYERIETCGKLIPMLPTVVRLDGRSFSKFTKSFEPFDEDMLHAMVETTKFLVDESNAVIGYTQSDEITLILHTETVTSQLFFDGKKHKLLSNLASLASVKFYEILLSRKGDNMPKQLPSFDCRLFQVPNKMEAWNSLLWRVQDCIKNSIQMLAQKHISHKKLQGKNQKGQLNMLESLGVTWGNLPSAFKEGTFVRKNEYIEYLDNGDLYTRRRLDVMIFDCNFNKIDNRIEFLFDGENPKMKTD